MLRSQRSGLGITRQAAGKTIDGLERLGYVRRENDPTDARRKRIVLTARGEQLLGQSVDVFDALRASWAQVLGPDRLRALEADLRTVTEGRPHRLDVPGWFGPGVSVE